METDLDINVDRISHRKTTMAIRSRYRILWEFSVIKFYEFHESSLLKNPKTPEFKYLRTKLPALSFPRKREFPSRRPHARTPSFGFVTGK